MIYDFSEESFAAIQQQIIAGHVAQEIEFDDTILDDQPNNIQDWQRLFTGLSCATIAFYDVDDETLQAFLPILVRNRQVKNIKFYKMSCEMYRDLKEEAERRKYDVKLIHVAPRARKSLGSVFDAMSSSAPPELLLASSGRLRMLDLDRFGSLGCVVRVEREALPIPPAVEVGLPPRPFARLAGSYPTPRRSAKKSLPSSELDISTLTLQATPASKIATQFKLVFRQFKPLAERVGLRIYIDNANAQSLFLYVDWNLKQICTISANQSFIHDHEKLTVLPDGIEIFYWDKN
jgi:hypothetical protein